MPDDARRARLRLRDAYALWAPMYDAVVDRATRGLRSASLAALDAGPGERVLIDGIGTGLDLAYLPAGPEYVGVDISIPMLQRARRRADSLGVGCQLDMADAAALPYPDESFDHAVMHLIVAVVPDAAAALREVQRVLRPGGTVLVVDKFLVPHQRAPLRRLLGRMLRHVATRTDVVFEEALAACPGLEVVGDRPALARGWFRRIVLRRAVGKAN